MRIKLLRASTKDRHTAAALPAAETAEAAAELRPAAAAAADPPVAAAEAAPRRERTAVFAAVASVPAQHEQNSHLQCAHASRLPPTTGAGEGMNHQNTGA